MQQAYNSRRGHSSAQNEAGILEKIAKAPDDGLEFRTLFEQCARAFLKTPRRIPFSRGSRALHVFDGNLQREERILSSWASLRTSSRQAATRSVAERIKVNNVVRSGQSIIRGTRITVWDILGWLGAASLKSRS